jgi:Fic family protein
MIFQTPDLSPADEVVRDLLLDLWRRLEVRVGNQKQRWYGVLRRSAMAANLRGSNTIEGYEVSADDALAVADEESGPFEASAENYRAVSCYRDAMNYAIGLADDPHFRFDASLIRALHYMIVKYAPTRNPGLWRPGSARVLDERSGEIVYDAAPVEDVPELMDELAASVSTLTPHPVIQAAMVHLNLVMIHPFSDGNGRAARCLHSLVMARGGVLSPVFCSIEEYLGSHTPDYYRVLLEVGGASWNPTRDASPWIRFVLTAHFRQAQTFLHRESQMQALWNDVEDELARRKLPARALPVVAQAAFGHRTRRSTYTRLSDTTDVVATRDLRQLVGAGLFVAVGEKRGRHYLPSDELRSIGRRHLVKSEAPDPYELAERTAHIGTRR